MIEARGGVGEARVAGEVRALDHLAERAVEGLLVAHHEDVSVRRREHLRGHQAGVRRARQPLRLIAAREVPGRHVVQHPQPDLVEREIDVGALARALRLLHPGQQRERRRVARRPVDDGDAGARRRAARLAGDRHVAELRLDQVVEGRLARPRSAGPVAAQRAADDARVAMAQLLVGEPQPRRTVAAQVAEQRVRHLDEVAEDRAALGRPQVQCEAALAAVERLEEEAVLLLGVRRHVASHVAADGRILDLDDVRAEVGEVQRRERPGPVLGDRDHAQPLERPSPHLVCAHAASPSGGRRGSSTERRKESTGSPRWFSAIVSTSRTPRSGRRSLGRTSSTVERA